MDRLPDAVRVRVPRSPPPACGFAALTLLAALAMLGTLSVACAAEQTRTFAGRPVGDVLDELRVQGLTFIYNTRLVPASLRVEQEPRARGGLELATEILTAHRLRISQAAPGVFAVVASSSSTPRRAIDSLPAPKSDTELEEVVVHASRYRLATDLGVSEAVLTQEDVNNMPRLGDETLRAVQRLPGFASDGFSGLGAVRGGEPNETAIVLDGLRLYEPFHLKNFLSPISLLDSRTIESIEVYSGGFPVMYGDRMSAIIEANSVHPVEPRYYEAGLSLFHASLLASSQFMDGRTRGLVSARRSNVGDLARYSERKFGEPQYFDAFAKIDHEIDVATRASFDVLASSDRINAIRDGGRERASAEYRNLYAWGALEHDWSDAGSTRVILSYTDVNNDRLGTVDDPGQRVGRVLDVRNFSVVGLRADHRFDAFGLDQRLGFEVRRLWGRYEYESAVRFEPGFPLPGSPGSELQRRATPKPDGFESAAWWDGRVELGDRWTVLAGLRFDTQTYDGSGDAAQFAPRINILYDLSASTRVRASWGRFFQAQGINELQVEDGVDRFHQAQHADHLIVSLDHAFAPGLDLRIEAYRKYYRRLNPRFENLFNPLVLLPETELDRVMIDPYSARAEGVEALLRWDSQSTWRGWLAYVWSRAKDRVDGGEVVRRADQTHALSFGLAWASGPWTATLTDTFHTGWPTTRLSLVDAASGPQLIAGPRNGERLHYYNSLDLRVTRTFVLARGALDVFVEVSNAFQRENPCCTDYTFVREADGSVSLQEETDNWLPLVPSIGVLWRY